MYKKHLLIIFLLTAFVFTCAAQQSAPDTTKTKKDQLNLKRDSVTSKRFVPKVIKERTYHPDSTHSPHKAVMHSLIIPGWGQVYNHHWWKVPVIYAGLGLLADAIIYNQNGYTPNLIVAKYYEHGVPLTPGMPQYALYQLYLKNAVPQQTVYDLVDSYRRDRDLSILGFLGAWGIQMIDAYVDAKFEKSYTMDTNFTFKISPTIIDQQPIYAQSLNGPVIPGIKLTFTLR